MIGARQAPDRVQATAEGCHAGAFLQYVRKIPGSGQGYQKATELLPNDSHLLADYADALAV